MKRILSILALAIFIIVLFTSHPNHVEVKAFAGYPVHNLDTGLNYTTIQDAMDAPETQNGHEIFVEANYTDPGFVIHKSVSVIGQDRRKTFIDGNSSRKNVVTISASSVILSNFTIRRSETGGAGILVTSSHNSISNNEVSGCHIGIFLDNSSSNEIAGNTIISNAESGLYFNYSGGNNLSQNTIRGNNPGLYLYFSGANQLLDNWIEANTNNIWFYSSSANVLVNNFLGPAIYSCLAFHTQSNGNLLVGNTISDLSISDSYNNQIFHNNINSPPSGQFMVLDLNIWDNSFGEGNHWAKYEGEDLGKDGIGDTELPYYSDSFPLMSQVSTFGLLSDDESNHIMIITSETVSDSPTYIKISPTEAKISFDITGSGTAYCRVAVPSSLILEDFNVTVNDAEVDYDLHKRQEVSYWYLNFNVTLSTKEVIIYGTIPEFSSLLILPLFMLATLLAVIVYRREQRTKLHT